MKTLLVSFVFFISFILFIFSFLGCSSIYNIKNFPSKEKFYQNLNNFVKDKNVKICTGGDSVIHLNEGVEINDDTLIILNKKIKEEKFISLNEIKNIDYNNYQNPSAFLELKNGEKLEAEDIRISNDSMRFNNIKYVDLKSSISTKEIKEISLDSRWTGVIKGLLIGTLSGAAIGGLTHIIPATEHHPSFTPPYQRSEYNTFNSFMIGTVSGAFIGSIIGWLIGYDFIYQF